jgi:hypothetical protein
MCSGNQIFAAVTQGDCPTVMTTKWTNRNDKLYNQTITLYRPRIQPSLYAALTYSSYSIIKCTDDKDNILPYLMAYFGVGAIFDPADWTDPNNSGQTMVLLRRFRHGPPCISLDVKDYPGITDLGQ